MVFKPPDVSREGLKFYPKLYFLFFIFYQSTVLSGRAVNGHQMYFGGSVVGKASIICIEISPTSPLIITGVEKCEIWSRSTGQGHSVT